VLSQRDGTEQHNTMGDTALGRLGFRVVAATDINGDGMQEYAGGAPNAVAFRVVKNPRRKGKPATNRQIRQPRAGKTLLCSGADGHVLGQASGAISNGNFGRSIISLQGDKDNVAYLVVGAPGGNGGVFVYAIAHDGQLALLSSKAGAKKGARLGYALASGEVGDDGKQHIISSAPFGGDGTVYVLSGSATLGQL
jgi:hypothetical protein